MRLHGWQLLHPGDSSPILQPANPLTTPAPLPLAAPFFPFHPARPGPVQFTNPLMALLVVAGALTYMAYGLQTPRDKNNLILASALIIVVTLT